MARAPATLHAEQSGLRVTFAAPAFDGDFLGRAQTEYRTRLDGLEVDYVEIADFEPRVLAAAVRVGATRLIDNVVLEGEPA